MIARTPTAAARARQPRGALAARRRRTPAAQRAAPAGGRRGGAAAARRGEARGVRCGSPTSSPGRGGGRGRGGAVPRQLPVERHQVLRPGGRRAVGGGLGRAALRAQPRAAASWSCACATTGSGVPPRQRAALFEQFFRAHGETVTGVEGTGLGLSIVRETVESLGGRAWAEFPNATGCGVRLLAAVASGGGCGGGRRQAPRDRGAVIRLAWSVRLVAASTGTPNPYPACSRR